MIFKEGFWWPDSIKVEDVIFQTTKIESLKYVLQYWSRKNAVIQAGGSHGVWPKLLAKKMRFVYTFEPERISFECLVKNCPENNIFKFQCALGDVHKQVHFMRKGAACHRIMDAVIDKQSKNSNYQEGVHQITIDSLGIENVDMLLLDVEGNEYQAIQGAEMTIRQYRPLILFQANGEVRDCLIEGYLSALGYAHVAKVGADKIFTYRGKMK